MPMTVERRSGIAESQSHAPELQAKANKAFLLIINCSDYRGVLEHFRHAYEYRKQFRWLGESGRPPYNTNGLAYALRSALADYTPKRSTQEYPVKRSETPRDRCTPVDVQWKNELEDAVADAVCDEVRLKQFDGSLRRAGLDVADISTEELGEHITRALDQYYEEHRFGLTLEPW